MITISTKSNLRRYWRMRRWSSSATSSKIGASKLLRSKCVSIRTRFTLTLLSYSPLVVMFLICAPIAVISILFVYALILYKDKHIFLMDSPTDYSIRPKLKILLLDPMHEYPSSPSPIRKFKSISASVNFKLKPYLETSKKLYLWTYSIPSEMIRVEPHF